MENPTTSWGELNNSYLSSYRQLPPDIKIKLNKIKTILPETVPVTCQRSEMYKSWSLGTPGRCSANSNHLDFYHNNSFIAYSISKIENFIQRNSKLFNLGVEYKI